MFSSDISNKIQTSVFVVTGGAGFIGSNLVEQLIALKAKKVILLLIDGLGFEQFENSEEKGLVPNLTMFSKRRIHTVAPTTTATALTSLTTGKSPGEHGVVGYKIRTGNQILNALRWTTGHGSAVNEINPASFQPVEPFFGSAPPIVSPAQFHESGFSSAHLRGGDYLGYWLPSSMPVLINDSLKSGAVANNCITDSDF